jgi:hypothetical protein
VIPRILIVLIGSLFVAGATGGRSSALLRQEPKPSIALNLSATSLMVCVGSSLPLKLELTNRGADDFKVEKFEIWNHFTYGFEGDRQTGRGGGMGSSCINCATEPIVIAHDQTYKSSFDFNLDHDFFSDAGKYTVKLKIADVESNELQFELFNCQ